MGPLALRPHLTKSLPLSKPQLSSESMPQGFIKANVIYKLFYGMNLCIYRIIFLK
jgi:hypothetical protein